MRTMLLAALMAGIAWAMPAAAQLPTAADLKAGAGAAGEAAQQKATEAEGAAQQKATEAEADPTKAAADAQKAAGEAKANAAAKTEEAKAAGSAKVKEQKTAVKTKTAKKARVVKAKAKTKVDAKASNAGVLQPDAEGAVKAADDKAEQKIDAATK
jgi:hypothetical protein